MQPHGVDGQLTQLPVIAHEELCQRAGQQVGCQGHGNAPHRHQEIALAEHIFELFPVFRSEMEADDGGGANGVAHKNSHKDKAYIHDDPVGRHAVLSQKFQQLKVIDHGGNGAGNIAHKLRSAVAAGLEQRMGLHRRKAEVQSAAVFPVQEKHHGDHRSHGLAQARGQGRSCQAPAEHPHQQRVQHHVGHTGADRGSKPQPGLFRGDQEALEHILEHKGHVKGNDDPAVEHAVRDHLLGGA